MCFITLHLFIEKRVNIFFFDKHVNFFCSSNQHVVESTRRIENKLTKNLYPKQVHMYKRTLIAYTINYIPTLVDEWDNLFVVLWLKTGALYEMIIIYKSTIFVYRLTGIICNVQSIIVKLHVMYTWSTCKSRSGIEIIYTFIFDVYLLCRGKKKVLNFLKFDFSCTSSNPS